MANLISFLLPRLGLSKKNPDRDFRVTSEIKCTRTAVQFSKETQLFLIPPNRSTPQKLISPEVFWAAFCCKRWNCFKCHQRLQRTFSQSGKQTVFSVKKMWHQNMVEKIVALPLLPRAFFVDVWFSAKWHMRHMHLDNNSVWIGCHSQLERWNELLER